MTVVDLGAAPGSWSQYLGQQLGETGQVIACDILPMDPLPGVAFFTGRFSGRGGTRSAITAGR